MCSVLLLCNVLFCTLLFSAIGTGKGMICIALFYGVLSCAVLYSYVFRVMCNVLFRTKIFCCVLYLCCMHKATYSLFCNVLSCCVLLCYVVSCALLCLKLYAPLRIQHCIVTLSGLSGQRLLAIQSIHGTSFQRLSGLASPVQEAPRIHPDS